MVIEAAVDIQTLETNSLTYCHGARQLDGESGLVSDMLVALTVGCHVA